MVLTIAIPTYNRANVLERALNSILFQLDERVEILVSDNASTDDTKRVMDLFCAKYPRIRYVCNQRNLGPDKNFLQCYSLAKGEFILLLGDDDIIVENSLNELLDFIEQKAFECDLIFLNHAFFKKNYQSIESCQEQFWHNGKNFITTDKNKWIDVAKYQVTYMSAFALRKEAYDRVINPEKYIGTHFIHTCILFDATKGLSTRLAAFARVVAAQNTAYEDSGFYAHPERIFEVFGKYEEYVLCELAPRFGYDSKKMEDAYSEFILSSWPKTILSLKAQGNEEWKEYYFKYADDALKKHPKLRKKIKKYIIFPDGLAKILRKIKKLFKK